MNMTTDLNSELPNSENPANSELPEQIVESTSPVQDTTPVNDGDSIEPATPEQLVEPTPTAEDTPTVVGTDPIAPVIPAEHDLLEGFDPAKYGKGVSGDNRFRILNLYMGYLMRNHQKDLTYDKVKLRIDLDWWDRKNKPPIGTMKIWAYVKANYDRWLEYNRSYYSK